jgi:hypothetical protein
MSYVVDVSNRKHHWFGSFFVTSDSKQMAEQLFLMATTTTAAAAASSRHQHLSVTSTILVTVHDEDAIENGKNATRAVHVATHYHCTTIFAITITIISIIDVAIMAREGLYY